jgi:hypothetical protein
LNDGGNGATYAIYWGALSKSSRLALPHGKARMKSLLIVFSTFALMACVSDSEEKGRLSPGSYDTVFQDWLFHRRTAKLDLNADGTGKYSETQDGECVIEQSNFHWKNTGHQLTLTQIQIRKIKDCDAAIFSLPYQAKNDSTFRVRNEDPCEFDTEILESEKNVGWGWINWQGPRSCI